MATHEDDPQAEQRRDDAEKHPLLIWTGLDPGDIVSIRALGNRAYVGTVEQRTKDGLIIWIRDDLNERKLFHFHDCKSVVLVAPINWHARVFGAGVDPFGRSHPDLFGR